MKKHIFLYFFLFISLLSLNAQTATFRCLESEIFAKGCPTCDNSRTGKMITGVELTLSGVKTEFINPIIVKFDSLDNITLIDYRFVTKTFKLSNTSYSTTTQCLKALAYCTSPDGRPSIDTLQFVSDTLGISLYGDSLAMKKVYIASSGDPSITNEGNLSVTDGVNSSTIQSNTSGDNPIRLLMPGGDIYAHSDTLEFLIPELHDNQYIDTISYSSDSLRISLYNDSKAQSKVYIPMSSGTDIQKIDTFKIQSDSLIISIERDGEKYKGVSLSPYLDNTDGQTLSFSNPNLSISGGNTVDLSSLTTTTTNVITENGNVLTSVVNGISDTTLTVRSVSNTSSTNNLSTTVNGVVGSNVNIINSNALSSSTNTITSTVNGVANSGTGTIINTNVLNLSGNQLTETINGQADTSLVIGNVTQTLSSNNLSTTVNGVQSNTVSLSGYLDNTDNQALSIRAGKGTIDLTNSVSITLADSSATNELQTLSVATGTTTLSNSGGSMTIAGGGINSIGTAGSTITITGTEVDGSTSNELQNFTSTAGKGTLRLDQGGGFVILNDSSSINELQTIDTFTYSLDTIRLSLSGDGMLYRTIYVPSISDTDDQFLSYGTKSGNNIPLNIDNGTGVTITQGSGITINRNSSTQMTIDRDVIAHNIVTNGNIITQTVDGTSDTTLAIRAVNNTSTTNSISTTVNGVTGSSVNIINSNSLSSSGNTITSTVNGVANTGTGTIINTNVLNLAGNQLTETINGQADTSLVIGNVVQTLTSNNLSTTVNGVQSNTVSLSPYLDNTDGQNLIFATKSGVTNILNITNGAGVNILDGTNITISRDASNQITVNAANEVDGSISNEGSLSVTAGTGTTSLIHSNTSGSTDVTLAAGTNITLSENTGTGTITIDASASGETNTASNLGGGLANYDSKSGVDLRFNTFKAADFDLTSNLISFDNVNAQKATSGQNGILTSTDWTTFNNKLSAEVDGSTTNEIQTLTYTAGKGTLRLDLGGGYVVLNDSSATNEIQSIDTFNIVGNYLKISLLNDSKRLDSVNLASYLDNTDGQTLSFSSPNLTISTGNTVDLSSLLTSGTTNVITQNGNVLTSVVNGVSDTTLAIRSVSNTSSTNSLSTTVNGVTGSNVNIVNSISNTSSANNLSTTVNGQTGSNVSIINSNALSSSVNTITSTINGIANTGTGTIINTNVLNLAGNQLTETINGVADTSLVIGTVNGNLLGNSITLNVNGITDTVLVIGQHTLTSSANSMTNIENGLSASANIVNSISNTSSVNNLNTTVNGQTGSNVSIINTNVLNLAGNQLTETINGVADTSLVIGNVTQTLSSNNLSTTVNGVVSNTVSLAPYLDNTDLQDLSFAVKSGADVPLTITNGLQVKFTEGSNITLTRNSSNQMTIGSTALADGDKGDITVSGSGTTWTIDPLTISTGKVIDLAITNAKINDLAWSKLTGTPTTLSGYGITDALSNSTTSAQDGYFGDVYLKDDTSPSHYLKITDAENLTAARTLSINTGDASRILTFSGDATISGTNTGDQTITLSSDVTGSGTGSFATTIANNAVTNAKAADMATQTFKGRTTAGTGDPEDLTIAQAKTMLNLTGTNSGDQTITLTSDVTGSGTGSFATTIANDAVTYAKLQNVAANSVLANTAGSSGDVQEINLSANQLVGRGSSGNASAITLGGILSMSGAVLSATEVDGSTTNEIQNLIFATKSGATNTLNITSGAGVNIVDGTNVTISRDASNQITVNATGEANTASSLGVGLSVYDSKSGVDLRFNTFKTADFDLTSNLLSIDYTNGQAASGSVKGFLTSTDWTTFNNKLSAEVDGSTTNEVQNLSYNAGTHAVDISLSGTSSVIPLALADGATEGLSSFTASDFNATAGNIDIDYTNGQAATGSVKGFLTSTDWTTFNNKVATTRAINTTAPLSGGGDLSADRTLTTSMSTNKLIGRSTAGTGVMEEITIGTGLSLSAGTLTSTGGYTDENAQDAVGLMINSSLQYVDATPLLAIQDRDFGDISVTGSGLVWTLDNNTVMTADIIDANVTNAKLANVATQTFKGRTTAGTGVPEDLTIAQAKTMLNLTGTNSGDQTITLTGDVTGSGTGSFATTISTSAVTSGKILDLTIATGDLADSLITAVKIVSNAVTTTGLATSSVTTAKILDATILNADIANATIANAKLADVSTATFKGRTTAGTGSPEDMTVAQSKTLLNLTGTNSGDQTITLTGDVTGSGTGSFATTIATSAVNSAKILDGAIATADVANDAITYAKLQNVSANSYLGNNTASSGDVAEVTLAASQLAGRGSTGNLAAISLGGILSMSTTTLSATEVDGSISNEGNLTVGAGTSTTSIINSNTSGSTGVTLTAAGINAITESGNVITLTATEVDGSTTNEIQTIDTFKISNDSLAISLSSDGQFYKGIKIKGYRKDTLYYFPEDYGAIQNDATDDRVAIQAAIDSACNRGGGVVFLNKGEYRVTTSASRGTYNSGLHMCSNVILMGIGASSVIKSTLTTSGQHIISLPVFGTNMKLMDFKIKSDSLPSGAAIFATSGGVSNVTIDRVIIDRGSDWGILLKESSKCVIQNCDIQNGGSAHCVEINNCNNMKILNNWLHSNATRTYFPARGNGIETFNNHYGEGRPYDNLLEGNSIEGTGGGISVWGDSICTVSNNHISNIEGHGIIVPNTTDIFNSGNVKIKIIGNTISRCGQSNNSSLGIYIQSLGREVIVANNSIDSVKTADAGSGGGDGIHNIADGTIIEGNNIQHCSVNGINNNGGKYVTISNNHIMDCSVLTANGYRAISCYANSYGVINNNVCIDTRATKRYDISIFLHTCDYVTCIGNAMFGWVNSGLYDNNSTNNKTGYNTEKAN
ncbi:MAG: hypothetical protein ABI851_12210 [Saprospiraceae bacterium]